MPPIVPVRTKVYTLIQDGVTDPSELLSAIGYDEQWARDIVESELERERVRKLPGVYCPAASTWINSLPSSYFGSGSK